MSKREVKTRFPVARIKRLMQSDDEIGKVAQATPVVVAKALELFMVSLVDSACEQARERHSKRVLPSHLKQAVLNTEQFDFLAELMSKYPDPVATPAKSNTKSSTRQAAAAAAAAIASEESSIPEATVKEEDYEEEEEVDEEEEEEEKPPIRRRVIRPEDL